MAPIANAVVCFECQASNRPGTRKCWLCGATLNGDVPYAEIVDEPVQLGGGQFSLAELMILITVVAIAAGIWAQDPGTGFSVTVIGLPALVATFVRTLRRRRRGENVTWADKVATFLLTAAMTFTILTMIAVAAVIALFIFCIYLVSTAGF